MPEVCIQTKDDCAQVALSNLEERRIQRWQRKILIKGYGRLFCRTSQVCCCQGLKKEEDEEDEGEILVGDAVTV